MTGQTSARHRAHDAAADAHRIAAAVRLGAEGRAAIEAAATAGLAARLDLLRGEIAAEGRHATLRHAMRVRAIADEVRAAMAARPAGGAEAAPSTPPVLYARLAPDGHHYVALPHRHGQFHRVTHHG